MFSCKLNEIFWNIFSIELLWPAVSKISDMSLLRFLLDTGSWLNVHKTFGRRKILLRNVLCPNHPVMSGACLRKTILQVTKFFRFLVIDNVNDSSPFFLTFSFFKCSSIWAFEQLIYLANNRIFENLAFTNIKTDLTLKLDKKVYPLHPFCLRTLLEKKMFSFPSGKLTGNCVLIANFFWQ